MLLADAASLSLQDLLSSAGSASHPVLTQVARLAVTLAMAEIVAWHYVRFAKVLSNKRKFARSFVLIAATTQLVIGIVSASLALSLGLVGALSIVRFRTPIKEPEELSYLFLAIATGIGVGAGEALATGAVIGLLLLFLALRSGIGLASAPLRSVLQVAVDEASDASSPLDALLPVVQDGCRTVDLRRVDSVDGRFSASLLVELPEAGAVSSLVSAVQGALPGASVSFVERDSLA